MATFYDGDRGEIHYCLTVLKGLTPEILSYPDVRSMAPYHIQRPSLTLVTYSVFGGLLISHVTQCTTFFMTPSDNERGKHFPLQRHQCHCAPITVAG